MKVLKFIYPGINYECVVLLYIFVENEEKVITLI